MRNEINEIAEASATINWEDRVLWILVGFVMLGHLARNLVKDEPFNLKKFLGEMILSGLGAVAIYTMGLLQGLSEVEIMLVGVFASLGGIRALEWVAKIYKAVKNLN
ncbi:hypothetical protein [Vreelandella sulfidaeris]|uniref:Holin n=1 Tax=Vreelandella sulfidaeris TaxID=115553 RepID=A0A455U6Q3_9GAMM|nr:hypothetical protein HSBAA_29510 [Halomonas sulfidaeris]